MRKLLLPLTAAVALGVAGSAGAASVQTNTFVLTGALNQTDPLTTTSGQGGSLHQCVTSGGGRLRTVALGLHYKPGTPPDELALNVNVVGSSGTYDLATTKKAAVQLFSEATRAGKTVQRYWVTSQYKGPQDAIYHGGTGTLTVTRGGLAGSIDATLAANTGYPAAHGTVHIQGRWSCSPSQTGQ